MSHPRRRPPWGVFFFLAVAASGRWLAPVAAAPRAALDEKADRRLAQPAALSVEGKPLS